MEFNSFAKETAKAPNNGYTNLPNDSWGWYEAVLGMILGMYPVISARARDYDCWSRHLNLSLRMVDWHYYFDGVFDPTLLINWLVLTYKIVFDVLLGYNMFVQCKSQLDWGVFSGWAKYFSKSSSSQENPLADDGEFSSFMMEAPGSQFEGAAETKGNWLHEMMISLDPEGVLIEEADAQEHPVVGAAAAITSYAQPVNGWRLASQIMILIEESVKTVHFYSSNFYYYGLAKAFFKLVTNVFVMIDHIFRLNIIVPTPAWNRYRTNGAY